MKNNKVIKINEPVLQLSYGNFVSVDDYLDLQKQLEEKNKVIDDVVNFIEKGDLLYLASKCSTVYKDNIEIVAIYDRLKELLEKIKLERGKDE